jgi:hypothetical protein
MVKKLQHDSDYAALDTDGDGIVTDAELERHRMFIELENEDQKADAQRKMAWFALIGMLFYPAGIFFTSMVGLDKAAELVAEIASVYFVSVAAIVAAFFGAQAIGKK